MTSPNSNSPNVPSLTDDESEICKATRAIIEGSSDYPIKDIEPSANSQDVALCVDLLVRRIIAESDRGCRLGADAIEIWESVLAGGTNALEQTPLGLIGYILAFAQNELVNLRVENHDSRRSSSSILALGARTATLRRTGRMSNMSRTPEPPR